MPILRGHECWDVFESVSVGSFLETESRCLRGSVYTRGGFQPRPTQRSAPSLHSRAQASFPSSAFRDVERLFLCL